MTIPVNEPVITPEAKKYVNDALDTGWISSAGKYIGEFEKAFASYAGVQNGIATMNGTAALHLALVTVGVGHGDEVIVPNFTMIATAAAVLYTGATPVFVDAEPETFNIDVKKIEGKITKKTKAIMPVHIYGHSCDMDPILALAEKHDLFVIEDAAEAHGATYKGKKCGSMGDMGCFSFYGNKIVTTGEGGMVVTDDAALAGRARSLADLAHSVKKRFWHEELGFNYRMTNLQAAVGLGQMQQIDKFVAKKKWMAAEYEKRLKDVKELRLPITKPYAENVYWMYGVLVEKDFPMSKDAFRAALKEKGVDTRDFFYSTASQPLLKHLPSAKEKFPVSDMLAEHGMYLPSGLALTEKQIAYVCDTILSVA
ncbi:DegT/DnrJ/EryC1/StrS family aminotransferase [Candidatus Peregrinibacteria bacterium]|nr:DegT/DnrJ/EryC1/StrS family aminotransferase [Candidatus Peregrinibacteria bacterium]